MSNHRRRASGADWLCALRGLMIDYIASSHASRRLGLSGMCASRRTSSAQAMDGCYCAPKVGAGRGVGIDWIPCATAEQLASMTPTTMTRNTQKSSQAAHCIPKKPKNPASVAEPAVLPRPVGNHWAPFHHHLPSGERCGPGGGGCTAASIEMGFTGWANAADEAAAYGPARGGGNLALPRLLRATEITRSTRATTPSGQRRLVASGRSPGEWCGLKNHDPTVRSL